MASSSEQKELKKEIIEARALIIKSNNLANSLATEMRSIAKRQTSYERHLAWNSIVAYIIFVVLIFVGVQLVYTQRQSTLEDSLTEAKKRAEAAETELAGIKKERRSEVKTRDEDVMVLYDLINDRDREAAIKAFEELNVNQLTELEQKLIGDSIEGFKFDLSMQHYTTGLELSEKGKFAEAVEEFRTSLRYKADAGHATWAKIEMANALRLQGKPREAIAVLQRLLEEHLDRALSDDAYWFLALSHYEAHQRDEARSVLKSLMRQFPDSQYYRAARIKAAEIQLHLYTGGKTSLTEE